MADALPIAPVQSATQVTQNNAGSTGLNAQNSASNVPSVTSTPSAISSDDAATGFANNASTLATKTAPPVTPATDPTGANATQIAQTSQQQLDTAKASGETPSVTTGDPVLDNLQLEADKTLASDQADATAQKAQVQQNLQTNLATNDASFGAQINNITNTYSALIDTQTRVNTLANQRATAYGLATGNALAAPVEFTNAVTDTEQAGISAISKLDSDRDAQIETAKAAESAGDAKSLEDAMNEVNTIEGNMKTEASNLQDQVATRYATLQKVETDQQTELAKLSTQQLATATSQYGSQYTTTTDSATKNAIIQKIVAGSGGTLSYGDVYTSLETNATAQYKQQQTAQTDSLTIQKDQADIKQTQSATAKNWATATKTSTTAAKGTVAKGGGTDGAFKYSADDVSSLASLLNTGGTLANGTQLNGRGSDGYVDPGAYNAAYTSWIQSGGTPKGFLKVAPITNVNPTSYSALPAAIQPKAKATTTTNPQPPV
jgi:hypothetical protein